MGDEKTKAPPRRRRPLFSGLTLEAQNLLRQYPKRFRYNAWAEEPEMDGKPLKENDYLDISLWLQGRAGIEWDDKKLYKAITALAREDTYNPLLQYLDRLEWDGEDHIEALATLLEPTDLDLTTRYLTRWLISGVARAFSPGVKADLMLIIVGEQGIGKSRFARGICPLQEKDLFLEDFSARITRDEKLKLRRRWIVEMSELKGMREARVDVLKSFLATRDDNYRVPYGRDSMTYPRRCIFVGTTNESNFLKDDTGERRFMVVESQTKKEKKWDETAIVMLRDKVWSQAVALYRMGMSWWLNDAEEAAQTEMNKLYVDEDPWTGPVLRAASLYAEIQRPFETLQIGFEIDKPLKECGQREQERVNSILRRNGWVQKALTRNGKKVKLWLNPNPPERPLGFDEPRQSVDLKLTNGIFDAKLN